MKARHATAVRLLIALGAIGAIAMPAAAQPAAAVPSSERQQALVRIVRQDCGACHGMRLTGGLGPALTREALAERSLDTVTATVLHGRPGTPMPGWQALLSEADVGWIAGQLKSGFPAEARGAR